MQLYENIFLNTDKIIQGQEYTLVYRGKYFEQVKNIKCPEQLLYIVIGDEKIQLDKKDYGYTCQIEFNENKNDLKIVLEENKESEQTKENINLKTEKVKTEDEKIENENEIFTLYAITEPIHLNVLKINNKQNLIKQKEKNFLFFPEQLLNAINKAIKIFPKVLENRMNTNKLVRRLEINNE